MIAKIIASVAVLGTVLVAGCATTEDANKQVRSQYIGRPADSFFARYGAPNSTYRMNNGGTVYNWRGGETVVTIPAQYRTVETPVYDPWGSTTTRTSTTVTRPDDSTKVTETRTTRTGDMLVMQQQVMTSPAREKTLLCEARITTDDKGIITDIAASRDTDGEGFSLSRCAEVFGVKK